MKLPYKNLDPTVEDDSPEFKNRLTDLTPPTGKKYLPKYEQFIFRTASRWHSTFSRIAFKYLSYFYSLCVLYLGKATH